MRLTRVISVPRLAMWPRACATLALVAALLAGCALPEATAIPSASTPPPATATAEPSPAATSTPDSPPFSLGAAQWLGRGRIVDACFTPDGRLLAAGWANGVSVWSAETGAERWWQPTNTCLLAVDIHPQGRAVAALLEDGTVALFDAATGDARRFQGAAPKAYLGDITWSPDGERIAFQCIGPNRGDPIYLLDAQSGAVQEVPASRISSSTRPQLVWSPDGEAITLACLEACSAFIDVRTGETRFTLGNEEACYSPSGLAWSPDGRALAALRMGRLDLLDASGQALRSLEGGGERVLASEYGRSLVFGPDGKLLVSRGGQAPHPVGWTPLLMWEVETGRMVARLQGNREREDRLAVALDGDNLVSLYATGEITHWRLGAGEAEEAVLAWLPALPPELPLVWSADGSKLAAAGPLGQLMAAGPWGGLAVWDTATGAPLATFGAGFTVPALSLDGGLLALTDGERQEEVIYDLAAGQVVRTLPGATPILQGAAFSPDGRLIAYGADNRALVAEVATGRVLAELAGYPEGQAIARVIWAPDGNALVVASAEPHAVEAGALILWQRGEDGSFRELLRTRSVHAGYSNWPVALFSPDGALVALEEMPAAEPGASIAILDRTSEEVIRTIEGYYLGAWASADVLLAAEEQYYTWLTRWNVRSGEKIVGRGSAQSGNYYAPGGAYYATAASSLSTGGIVVREWETGRRICSAHHGAGVFHISWSPDGRKIASLATNGTIVVWTVGEGSCAEP